uniref:Serpin domain-containing protein n=1 Tax=Oryza punctata TaxID=4537 RepID=A0A0E0ME34_ORYPU
MGNPPAAGAPRRRCCAIQGLVVLFLVYVLAVLVLAGSELFRDDDQLDLCFPSSPGIGSSSSARVLLSPRSLVLRLGEITRRGGTRWWWTGGDRPESDSPTSDGGKGTNSSPTEACSRRCAATGLMGMSLRLAKQLSANAEDDGAGNLVFSPLSIYSALTVVTVGARGTTLDELLGIVRALPGCTATGGPRVAHACGLWHERTTTLKPAFRAAAAASFNAAARAVDFLTNPEEARKEINSWVATATENLIDTILPPGSVGTSTRLVVEFGLWILHSRKDADLFGVSASAGSTRWRSHRPCPGLTELALRLARRIPAVVGDFNLVFSPLSLYAALALVAEGAGGDTLSEFLGVLGVGSQDELAALAGRLAGQALADRSRSGGPRVSFVSGLWHDKSRTLTPSFRDAAFQSFMAETRAADFREKPGEAVKQINAWARKATNSLIDSLIDGGLPADTDVVVANAVYFKGKWEAPFMKACTKTAKFHRLDGAAVDARFMRNIYDPSYYIACHGWFKVLRLPYDGGHSPAPSRFSMCAFLPDARDGLWDLVDKMASTPGFLQAKLPTEKVVVGKFELPKFKLTSSGDIAGVLHGMGLEVTFSDKADLSKMVVDDGSGRTLTMNRVVHKAVIEVNEEGTEAAASVLDVRCGMSMTPEPRPVLVDFVADHPFAFFVIEETTGAVVFAGHVLDPSSTAGALDDDEEFDHHGLGIMGCLRHLLDRFKPFLRV